MSNLRDPFQNITPYDPHDHESWKFAFTTALMLGNYNNILSGTETAPIAGGASSRQRGSDSGTESAQAAILAEDSFTERNATIFRVLVQSVMKCSLHTERGIALTLIRKVASGDGKAAYDAIIKHHQNPSQQNKCTAAKKFINEKMTISDTISSYKLRVETDYQQALQLKVNMEDLKTTIFIDGLSSDFDSLKPSLYAAQDITFEKASELSEGHALRLTEQRRSARPSPLHAMLAIDTSGESVELDSEEVALLANFRSSRSSSSSGGASALKRKNGLDHDIAAHPHSPTEYERTLTCENCGIERHCKRTCNKKKRKIERASFAFVSTPAPTPSPLSTTELSTAL